MTRQPQGGSDVDRRSEKSGSCPTVEAWLSKKTVAQSFFVLTIVQPSTSACSSYRSAPVV